MLREKWEQARKACEVAQCALFDAEQRLAAVKSVEKVALEVWGAATEAKERALRWRVLLERREDVSEAEWALQSAIRDEMDARRAEEAARAAFLAK